MTTTPTSTIAVDQNTPIPPQTAPHPWGLAIASDLTWAALQPWTDGLTSIEGHLSSGRFVRLVTHLHPSVPMSVRHLVWDVWLHGKVGALPTAAAAAGGGDGRGDLTTLVVPLAQLCENSVRAALTRLRDEQVVDTSLPWLAPAE